MLTGYRASTRAVRPREVLSRPRGITVATTVDAAFTAGVWPCRIYRLEVDPGDVRSSEGETLRVASCRFESEVPVAEILGPRAAEVDAVLDRIPQVPWCRPAVRAPTDEWMSAHIEAHVRALAECTDQKEVSFADVRNLHDAKLLPDDLFPHDDERPVSYRPELFALLAGRPVRRNAQRAVGLAAAAATYAAIWDPLWTALHVFAELDPVRLGTRDLPLVQEALAAARTPAREASRDYVLALASGEAVHPQIITDAKYPAVEAFARIIARRSSRDDGFNTKAMMALVSVWTSAWTTAVRMAAAASAQVQLLISDYGGPNPWAPLLDLWLAGGVPVAEAGGITVVYWCCAFE